MKIKRYFKWMICLTVATLAFTACEDQPDAFENTGGLPEVSYIRLPYAASSDSLIVSGYMGNTICMVGNNLTSIRRLYFNDQEATLNTSYITGSTLLVDIPNTIPGVVSDKIYMVNCSNDTVTYDFHVSVPAPTVRTMSFEYAPVGSVVTINGDYFIDDPNVPLSVKFGEIPAVIDHFTKTAIDVVVPEGATESAVTVETVYGATKSVFHYRESRGLMFDFDGITGLGNHGWHNVPIETDADAPSGNYIMLGDGATLMAAEGPWNDSKFAFEYWPGDWSTPTDYPADGIRLFDLVDFNDFKNMAIKFEMCIPAEYAWGAGALQVIFAGTDKVTLGNAGTDIYGNAVPGPNNTYFQNSELPRALYRPWTASGPYHTNGKWITVTLPIATEFIYAFEGGIATGALKKTDFASLVLFVVGGGISGTDCTPLIKIDNIRAVPN